MITSFKYDYYAYLLDQLIDLGSSFHTFNNFPGFDDGRITLLRHDVDKSVAKALAIARIEAQKGIASTFFFRVHSNFYNPFGHLCYGQIREIIKLGHEIGLHSEFWDTARINHESGTQIFKKEKVVLETITDQEIKSFSLHRTTGSSDLADMQEMAEFIAVEHAMNFASADRFQTNWKYISDSSGYWREGDPIISIKKNKNLHILTHPDWWFDKFIELEDPVV